MVLVHSKAIQRAAVTPLPVLPRSLATPPATPIRPMVVMPSLATQLPARTRPMVLVHFLATPPVSIIRPVALTRSIAILSAISTPPTVLMRSIATLRASKTQLAGIQHYIATQPAAPTSRWVFRPARISPRAVPTLTLATLVLQVSPEPSALAQPQLRGKPLSPALAEQRLQVA